MDNSNDFATGMILGENRNNYGYNNGFGGDGLGFFWIFALLMLNNGGFWGNNRGGNPVTEADLCQSQSFAELKGTAGRIVDEVNGVNINLGNAICNLGYETLRNFNNLEAQLSSCCCGIEKLLLENKYQAAQNTAEINANTTAQVQKILDAICGNRMADMQNQINQLQLNAALCGVVRYPNQTTFNAGFNPFFGWGNNCNSCCGNGNI